ncbi:hypothetical protein V8E36_004873 [Tilletia maclaganii]
MLMPSFKALLSSVLLATTAVVAKTDGPYGIDLAPAGIEKGILNTTLACSVTAIGFLPLGTQQIGFGVSARLPGRVNVGQPFSIVAATRLIVPKSLNSIAGLFGARYYTGTVDSVIVNTPGADPSSTDVAKGQNLTIPVAPLNPNGVSVLEVPGNSNVLTVGPLTASSEGNVIISFGAIAASIKTLDKNQKNSFVTAKVSCPAQKRPTSLAYIAVGTGKSTTAIVPKSIAVLPQIPPDSTAGVTGFNYFCDFSGFVQGTIRVSLGGVKSGNAAVRSGGAITLSQGQGNIILSTKLVKDIKTIVKTASTTTVTLTTFNIKATNASPAVQNIIPEGGVVIENIPVKGGAVATVPPTAPQQTLPDITFTAGASGSTALLSIADAAGSASLKSKDGEELLTIDFTCAALEPNVPIFPYDIA